MVVFWSYFRDFIRAQKIEVLTESKNLLTEVFQTTGRLVLAEKKMGVKCTLKVVPVYEDLVYPLIGQF